MCDSCQTYRYYNAPLTILYLRIIHFILTYRNVGQAIWRSCSETNTKAALSSPLFRSLYKQICHMLSLCSTGYKEGQFILYSHHVMFQTIWLTVSFLSILHLQNLSHVNLCVTTGIYFIEMVQLFCKISEIKNKTDSRPYVFYLGKICYGLSFHAILYFVLYSWYNYFVFEIIM